MWLRARCSRKPRPLTQGSTSQIPWDTVRKQRHHSPHRPWKEPPARWLRLLWLSFQELNGQGAWEGAEQVEAPTVHTVPKAG